MKQRRILLALAALGAAALVTTATLLSARTSEPSSAFDPDGTGATQLVEDARAEGYDTMRLLGGPRALDAETLDPQRSALVYIATPNQHLEADVEAVQEFLHQGGSVLFVDNFQQTNSISVAFGITFERVRLVEADADGFDVTLDGTTYRVHAPAPTAIHADPVTAPTILSSSSPDSFLDRDGDGLVTQGDPPGPFPFAVETAVGEEGGRILAIGDPSIFLDDADAADNARFRAALLLHLLPQGGTVLIDESQLPRPDPWLASSVAILGAAGEQPWNLAIVALALLIFGLTGLVKTRARWGPHRFHVDHYVRREQLRDPPKHPEHPDTTSHHRTLEVHWTRRGQAAIAGGFTIGVLGLVVGSVQATYFAAFLLGAAALAMTAAPARIRTERRVSTHRVDEEGDVLVDLKIQALSRRAGRVEVLDEVPKEFQLTQGHTWFEMNLKRGRETGTTYACKVHLRGTYHLGPTRLRCTDPFRLRTFETHQGGGNPLRVRPRHDPLNRIPFRSKIPEMTLGPHLVNRAGEGMEFHALRPYQTGDSIRIVNWKASARSKELVVNQRVHESMATITVFIDARRLAAAGVAKQNPLNEACRAALSIASGAIKARDKIRIFAYGDGIREIPDGPGPHEVHEIGDALADLRPAGATGFHEALQKVLPTLRNKSPVILLSGLEGDPSIASGMMEIRQRGMLPFAIALATQTQPLTEVEGPPEEDAEVLQRSRAETIRELHGAGVPLVDAVPGMPLSLLLRLGVT